MVKSIKGREIDMEALRKANENTVAVGNSNLNARGDLLGRGGKIIKTREELAREYHNKASKTVKNVPIDKKVTDEPQKKQEVTKSKTVKTKQKEETPLKKEMSKQKPSKTEEKVEKGTDLDIYGFDKDD